MRTFIILLHVAVLGALLQGCSTPQQTTEPEKALSQADVRVDFTDPVLNSRQILLFGAIDQRAAELTIQKLLFLDGRSHDPIDLYLQTPGGDMKYAFAIEETMRLIHSPVNTYALSECNSGGAMLLAAGTGKRRAFHGAVIVVHGLMFHGKAPAEYVDKIQDAYTDFWRKRSHLPQSWLPLPFGTDHFLSVEQALEYGIVDEIVDKRAP
jgi:ATP-dependent Clp protease protease subunit